MIFLLESVYAGKGTVKSLWKSWMLKCTNLHPCRTLLAGNSKFLHIALAMRDFCRVQIFFQNHI